MKPGLAGGSLLLLALSILSLVMLTAFESAFMGMSIELERIITFVLLVLPAVAGAALGMLSLRRREGWTGLAITGLVLNTLFALFFLALLSLAG
jgi:hypothetical protein